MKHHPSSNRASGTLALAKPVLIFSMLACALGWLATPVSAGITRDWTGAVSANWSDPNNWSPAGTPQNGDSLEFGFVDDSHRSMVNDLTGLTVEELNFVNNDYQLDGNSLSIDAYGTIFNGDNPGLISKSITTTVNCPLIFPGITDAYIYTWDWPGLFTESTADLHLNGPITVESGRLALFAESDPDTAGGNGHLYVSGVVSGNGDIYAYCDERGGHVSLVQFDGTPGNTFTGTLYVQTAGSAQIVFNKASGFVVTNRVAIGLGQTANLNFAGANQIGNSATIQIDAGAQLLLSGNNVAVGSLVLSNYSADATASVLDTGSTLVGLNDGIIASVDNDHVNPIIKGRLNLIGFALFDINGGPQPGLEIQAAIGGNGFNKTGQGGLSLSGNNTFVGDVYVTEGQVLAQTSAAFGQAGPTYGVHLNGGLVLLNSLAIGTEPLFVDAPSAFGVALAAVGPCSWAGPATLNTTLVLSANNTMDYSGSISGDGGLSFEGSGTLRLDGSAGNLFTGPLYVCGGVVQFAKPSGVNAYAGPLQVGPPCGEPCEAHWINSYQNVYANVTVYDGGLVNLNGANDDFYSLTFNGGEVDTGAGQMGLYGPLTVNPVNAPATVNGILGLPTGAYPNNPFIVYDSPGQDCDLTVNAAIIGGGSLIKQGPGKLCLAGNSTYTGATFVQEGVLEVDYDNALGGNKIGQGTIVSDGATLRFANGTTVSEPLSLQGTGFGGLGALNVTGTVTFNSPNPVLNDFDLSSPATVRVEGLTSTFVLNGIVSGTGPLTKAGPGRMVTFGNYSSTYSGDTLVNEGTLELNKPQNVLSVPNNLVVGPPPGGSTAVARFDHTGVMGGTVVIVNASSLLDLNGNNQALTQLTLNDGGSVQTGSGTLSLADGSTVNVGSLSGFGSHSSSTISGNIALPVDGSFATFNVALHDPTPPVLLTPELEVPATISGGSLVLLNVLYKEGLGQLQLTGNNTFLEQVRLNAGTLQVDGSQAQSPVLVNGGTLKGTGTVGPISMTASSAAVAPGDSPGILNCGNFDSGGGSGTLQVELNGNTPGTGYDQLNVGGTVNLNGVSLKGSLNFASSIGDQFTIINNDSSDAVVGTFSGLPQNAKLYIGGELFRITYAGGSGNDVLLTRLTTPPRPVLTIQRVPPASVRLLWQTNDPPFSLQSNTNLPATNWTAVSPLPLVLGTNNLVTNAISGSQQFYRLINP